MTPIETHPIAYYIATATGQVRVLGLALRLPEPWADLRLCLREAAHGWVVDHYPSGYAATDFRYHPVAHPVQYPARRLIRWLESRTPGQIARLRSQR